MVMSFALPKVWKTDAVPVTVETKFLRQFSVKSSQTTNKKKASRVQHIEYHTS